MSTNTYVLSHATFTSNGIGFALLDILTTNNNASTRQHKTLHVEVLHWQGGTLKKTQKRQTGKRLTGNNQQDGHWWRSGSHQFVGLQISCSIDGH
jgi:hypothetical protein